MTILLLALAFADSGRTMTFEDALLAAKRSNFDVAAAKAHLEGARSGIDQAWVALLPIVAAQGKYTHNYKQVELNFSGLSSFVPPSLAASLAQPIVIQKEEQLDGSVNATVPLVVPAAYFSLSAAKKDFAASSATFDVNETSVLYSVAQTFYAVAGADELLVARKDAVAVAGQTVSNTKASLDAGTAKRTDVNQAELSLLRAQQALLEAQDTRDQAYRSLSTLTQIPLPFQISAAPPAAAAIDTEALAEEALARRPEFIAYEKNVQSFSAQRSADFAKWAPSLSGFGQAHLQNYKSFSGDYYSWALGVELDWTIYDGGARDAGARLAKEQMVEAEAHIAALKASVKDDIENAAASIGTKRKAVSTAEQSAALARETLSLTRVQFEAGISKQLDVLQAQDSLVSAEVSLAQSRFDLALALLALQHAAGIFPAGGLK